MKRISFFTILFSGIVLSACSLVERNNHPNLPPTPVIESISPNPPQPSFFPTVINPTSTTNSLPEHIQLTFTSDERDGFYGIYAMEVLCGEPIVGCFSTPKLLFERESIILDYDWSPDGQKIVFVGPGQDGFLKSSDLYLANWDGSDVINLTQSEDAESSPIWSADGKSILFSVALKGYSEKAYQMDPVSGRETEILAASKVKSIRFPIPGRDTGKVIFIDDSSLNNVMYYSDLNGENKVEITRHPLQIFEPVFSPDQSRILYVAVNEEKPALLTDICMVNIDGSGGHKLFSVPNFEPLNPAWSRTMDLIAFSGKFFNGKEDLQDIFVVHPDGSDLTKITEDDGNKGFPKWRFDGLEQGKKDY